MADYGTAETDKLRTNVEEQLHRLLQQLQDCEELKEDLDEDEYEATKAETIEQLREMEASLEKMTSGNMTLVSELGSMRLAIRGAVSEAFKTPEILKMFANKQPAQLRLKLSQMREDLKLKRMPEDAYRVQAVEILAALKKLGEELNGEDAAFLADNMNERIAGFEAASQDIAGAGILSTAAGQVKAARQ
mmetsp:Transcript_22604/g.54228  ORF Transcript_22604/g.54228 Transcript_22604/m.54228 type:complete len:190 (+) Transcript_22604:96-665(+)|eukprot:CAMPEP_0180133624 /NCGR_PEP_ID=MMETSP0986-20121125/9649_1 /TAXON_ID=697907 /ORGANISM="non described non described, Strain CCMP2293" /LENGTH=189 /DNA_ID=CAMNT_0022073773 /DNA_START=86 /DNA_END=655 /DNA_ORIENTATION=+